jgi:hypothetical protein
LHRTKEEKDKILREREQRKKQEELVGCTFEPNSPRAARRRGGASAAASASPMWPRPRKSPPLSNQLRKTTNARYEEEETEGSDLVYPYVKEEATRVEEKKKFRNEMSLPKATLPKYQQRANHNRRETVDILFGGMPQENTSTTSLNQAWEAAYEQVGVFNSN